MGVSCAMNKKQVLEEVGHNIQVARMKKGLTQEQLAEKCNVSTQYIGSIKRGKTPGSMLLIIDKCNVLDISPNYIFNKLVKNSNDSIDILPTESNIEYLKLKPENKEFVKQTINHLYSMQNKR